MITNEGIFSKQFKTNFTTRQDQAGEKPTGRRKLMCLSSALCFFIILVFCILMHQLARLAASSRHSIPKRKSLCIRTIKHNLVNFLATGLEEVTFMRTALKRIRCAPKAKLHLEGQVVTITILDIAQKLAPQSRCKRIHEALVSSVPCWRSSQCGFFSYR